jgi:hypothetical protein
MQCPVADQVALRAVAAAVALVASAACGAGGAGSRGTAGAGGTVGTEAPRNPTVPTAAPLTTTTNPYAVPAVIDAAYVNRVLAGLDATMGDVLRLVARTKTIPREAYDRMRAAYHTDNELQRRIDATQMDLLRGLPGLRPSPGDKSSSVLRLVTARADCIFTEVRRDYSAVSFTPVTDSVHWVGLRPLDPARDPLGYNATRWAFAFDGVLADRSQPPDPCAG